MDVFTLIIQLICGAAGGNIAGKMFKSLEQHGAGNLLAGLMGGVLGSSLLSNIAGIGPVGNHGPDIAQLLAQAAGAGAGGGALAAIVGLLRNVFYRPSHS